MSALLAQIPLAPPLHTRLIALAVVEAFLAVIVVLLYIKYRDLKSVPIEEWWAYRLSKATPRMKRMISEAQEEYEAERAELGGSSQESRWPTRSVESRPESRAPGPPDADDA